MSQEETIGQKIGGWVLAAFLLLGCGGMVGGIIMQRYRPTTSLPTPEQYDNYRRQSMELEPKLTPLPPTREYEKLYQADLKAENEPINDLIWVVVILTVFVIGVLVWAKSQQKGARPSA